MENEKKKMGRPTDSPLVNNLKVRIDESTFADLERYCQQTNQHRAEAIRAIVKDYLNSYFLNTKKVE